MDVSSGTSAYLPSLSIRLLMSVLKRYFFSPRAVISRRNVTLSISLTRFSTSSSNSLGAFFMILVVLPSPPMVGWSPGARSSYSLPTILIVAVQSMVGSVARLFVCRIWAILLTSSFFFAPMSSNFSAMSSPVIAMARTQPSSRASI